jgi:hypothetical protein
MILVMEAKAKTASSGIGVQRHELGGEAGNRGGRFHRGTSR